MVINRVGPLSCAKIAGLLYLVIGLIVGAFVSLFALAGSMASEQAGARGLGALFGVGAIVFIPLFYGCIGFIGSLIAAWIYNVAAGIVGGVELDVR